MDGVVRVKFSMLLMTLILVLTPLTSLPIDSKTLDIDTPENNTVTRFDFKKEDIEKLTNGEVITHKNEDIRLLDGEIIRISDWEKIPISDEDKINIIESEEGKCIHLCEMDGDYCIKECKDDSLCMSDCASKTVDGFYDFNSEESSGINMFSLSVSGIIIALHC